jgi:Na+/proline symporter/lysophospholipid acyltransferase (LPLAT)-like uncharacterized protein
MKMEYLLFSLLYFAAIGGLGIVFSRRIKGLEGFFLASRRLSGPAVFVSLAASWIGATSVLISVEEASRRGISAFWVMGVPAVLTVVIFALFLARKIRGLPVISLPELVELRYGRIVRHVSAALIIWYMILLAASQMVAAGQFLRAVLGTPYITGLAAGVGIVILYSALGGYLSVVATDAVQFLLLTAALVVLLLHFGQNVSLSEFTAKIGESGVPFRDFFLEIKKDGLTVLSFTLAWIISPIAWQRIQSARTVKHARWGLWGAAALFFVFYWGLVGAGLGIAVSPPQFWLALSGAAGGLVFVAVAAAIMSTMDTAINTGALSLTRDFYQEIWAPAREYHVVRVSRFATLFIGAAAFLIATRIPSILTTLGLASEIMTVGFFIPGIFMLYTNKCRPAAGLLGLGCGSLYALFGFFCHMGLIPVSWPEWPYSVPGGLAVCAAGFAAGWIWDEKPGMWKDFRWRMIGIAGRFILRWWAKSAHFHIVGGHHLEKLRRDKKPVVVLVWHGRIFPVPYLFRKRGSIPLISPSQDGEIIARIVEGWGFRILRGSGSHTMVRSWKQLLQCLKHGGEVLMVPDGPKGPDRKLKYGSLRLAQKTGAYLVPFTFSTRKKIILNSWDKFMMFYPFHNVAVVFGRPFQIPADMDEQELSQERLRVEKIMDDLERRADLFFRK